MTRRAFTLVELLVVIAIIGLLSTVAVVVTASSREKARLVSGQSFEADVQRAIGAETALFYSMDEGSGTTVTDSSGNGNTGTFSATPPTWVTNTPFVDSKYALNFSGTNYISASKVLGISNSNFTISYWLKTTSATGQMSILANTGSGNGFRFGLSAGVPYFLIGNGANTEGGCGPRAINDGKWHQVVGVFNRSDLRVICYIDGQVGNVRVLPSTYPSIADGTLRIGLAYCCTAFIGQVDNVRVYTQNLSGISVNSLFEKEKIKFVAVKHKSLTPKGWYQKLGGVFTF